MAIIMQRAELPKSPAAPAQQVAESEVRQLDTAVKAPSDPTSTGETEGESPKPLSPHYAALARREKALRRERQAIQAEREALKAREEEFKSSHVSKKDLQERAQIDPQSVMKELGMTYEQLTQLILNQPAQGDPQYQKLVEKVQEIENTQAKTLTQFEEQQKRAYEQAVNQIRNETKVLIDSDSQFETIKEENASEVVVELIKETFEKNGILLSVIDAAKEVEDFLVEDALRKAKFKKVQQRLNPTTPDLQSPADGKKIHPELQQQRQSAPMKTLTHAHQAGSAPKSLSEKERVSRAILAFKGQLQ